MRDGGKERRGRRDRRGDKGDRQHARVGCAAACLSPFPSAGSLPRFSYLSCKAAKKTHTKSENDPQTNGRERKRARDDRNQPGRREAKREKRSQRMRRGAGRDRGEKDRKGETETQQNPKTSHIPNGGTKTAKSEQSSAHDDDEHHATSRKKTGKKRNQGTRTTREPRAPRG